jgi:5,10-methylenetetrahydromethanopterin reductase
MKLSLFAHWDAKTNLEAARTWERPGVDGIWIDESLFHLGALTLASAMASVTERLRIGIGIVTARTAHPSYLAMHLGTLAELSSGRVVLGLGSGVDYCVQQMGLETKLPRTAVLEAIEITRALVAGETVTYQGKVFSADQVRLDFEQRYAAPVLWGAMGDRSIQSCGEVADGWIISIMEPASYVERGVETLRSAARAAGRSTEDLDVVQFQVFACDDDAAVARIQAKELIDKIARLEFGYFVGMEEFVDAFVADLEGISRDDYLKIMQRLADGAAPAEAIPDELVEQISIVGDPDECAAQLRRFELLGVTEVALKPASGDLALVAAQVGDEIAPRLSALS